MSGCPVHAGSVRLAAHLPGAARFAVTNHHATTGRTITADELAARMSLTDDTARQLLAALNVSHPAGADRVNGSIVEPSALIGGGPR